MGFVCRRSVCSNGAECMSECEQCEEEDSFEPEDEYDPFWAEKADREAEEYFDRRRRRWAERY